MDHSSGLVFRRPQAASHRRAVVYFCSAVLSRAYLLNQTLAGALDYRQPKRARRALDEWLSWACRSKLAPCVRVSRTIRARKEGVLAYIRERLTTGIVEGTNKRLRMIARRAFGFHSPDALISMLYLWFLTQMCARFSPSRSAAPWEEGADALVPANQR